jgi:putative membrane protein
MMTPAEIDPTTRNRREKPLALAALALLVLLAWSGWNPYDRTTWALEVFPIAIVLPLLVLTYQRFPFTTLVYTGIFLHAIVLMVGGAYSYARVPLGFEIAELLHSTRNPYDKIGHLFQGFVPALVVREILIRGHHVAGRRMLAFIVVSIVLAISASYELLEWASAVSLGQGADEFLATQGDPWDTQSDMFCALVGACLALLLLSRTQNAQIARLAR